MPDGAGARLVAARRSLPSGRAVAGGFLVAVSAVGTFAAYRGASAGPSHRYVVAARDLPVGTTLGPSELTTASVDLPQSIAERAYTGTAAAIGRLTVAPVRKGELLQASTVADPAAADPRYQVSVPVERSRALAGSLQIGELVDVAATYGTGSGATTVVVARRAQVVRVDDQRRSSIGPGGQLVVALALTTAEGALAVIHASTSATMTFIRATGAAAAGAADGPDSYRAPSAARADGLAPR